MFDKLSTEWFNWVNKKFITFNTSSGAIKSSKMSYHKFYRGVQYRFHILQKLAISPNQVLTHAARAAGGAREGLWLEQACNHPLPVCSSAILTNRGVSTFIG